MVRRHRQVHGVSLAAILALFTCALPLRAETQPAGTADAAAESPLAPTARPSTPERVDVAPGARDEDIARRLQRILTATGWFVQPSVRVDQGVVFLEGGTGEERHRVWAGDLARRTEDVVAVVNRVEVEVSSADHWGPAVEGLRSLWNGLLRSLPSLLLGALLLAVAYVLGRGVTWAFRSSSERRGGVDLVREIRARGFGIFVFVLGVYLALRIAGLTRLAATLLGGTGIVGLVLGIAFRDIVENVLASLLLTRQQPFRRGDLVEIDGIEGYVQRLTLRATVLMNLEGNHVQIPNSTVYKSAIRNYSSNPSRRIDFTVGIGYADSIARAQEVALAVLQKHPMILPQPEPWVLADGLGAAVVNLRVYVWLDGTKHSWLKVRSSVIRLVKLAYQEHGISMPDEAREVVFPEGVPIRMLQEDASVAQAAPAPAPRAKLPPDASGNSDFATGAEAGLDSEATSIGRLGHASRTPEAGQDLLRTDDPPHR